MAFYPRLLIVFTLTSRLKTVRIPKFTTKSLLPGDADSKNAKVGDDSKD